MIDDRQLTPSSQRDDLVIFDREASEFGWRSYLGDLYGTPDVPAYAAPARAADLAGLPGAYICAGNVDGFRDDAIGYATRLNQAGVPAELHIYAGAPHGVKQFADVPVARRYIEGITGGSVPSSRHGRRAFTRPEMAGRVGEKTLWRLLDESASRASAALALNVEDLDLPNKQARITAKGGDTVRITWGTDTAHLLPRLIAGRERGPLFLSEHRPGPHRLATTDPRDICPDRPRPAGLRPRPHPARPLRRRPKTAPAQALLGHPPRCGQRLGQRDHGQDRAQEPAVGAALR
jgi:hypothetical protein